MSVHNLQDHGAYLLVVESVGTEPEAWERIGLIKVEYSEVGDTIEYAELARFYRRMLSKRSEGGTGATK